MKLCIEQQNRDGNSKSNLEIKKNWKWKNWMGIEINKDWEFDKI